MTEVVIRRVPCLSDGAMAAIREDLKDMSPGEAKYIAKALEEIEWLRERERNLAGKAIAYDLDQAGIESRAAEAVELVELRAKVAEFEHSIADAMEQIEAIQGSNATHMASVAKLEGRLEVELDAHDKTRDELMCAETRVTNYRLKSEDGAS